MTVSDDLHLRCAGEFHVPLDDHIGILGIQFHGVTTPAELLAGDQRTAAATETSYYLASNYLVILLSLLFFTSLASSFSGFIVG